MVLRESYISLYSQRNTDAASLLCLHEGDLLFHLVGNELRKFFVVFVIHLDGKLGKGIHELARFSNFLMAAATSLTVGTALGTVVSTLARTEIHIINSWKIVLGIAGLITVLGIFPGSIGNLCRKGKPFGCLFIILGNIQPARIHLAEGIGRAKMILFGSQFEPF